ncbi:SDR family NAD(P)-dependent oxidoreductase [Isoalcanivorax indicus]|uniref:SDR family NAD(P)-dependent oxidoreductase n=1 Tax=Isoalcanivorax indicus TaxID=2202653 RepID=UPI000DBA4572|nr:SDR family oxidoreductase [Isoalcanivorax indicus]
MSTALITGASSGIGEDIARELAARGLNLILVARRQDRLDALASALHREHGVTATSIACDLSDRDALNGLFDQVDAALASTGSTLTVLVNNAGTGFWAPFADQDLAGVQRDIDLNVTALTTLSHGFLRRARAHGQRSYLMNVASLAGILPTPRYAAYSGTKGYVRFFSEVLDYELRDSAISVTAACPGGVLTPFLDSAGQNVKKQTGIMTSPEVARLCVNAMYRGKVVYVPGLLNKFAVYTNLLPRRLRGWLLERSMLVSVEARPDASR